MGFFVLPLVLALQGPEFDSLGPVAKASPRSELCPRQGALWERSASARLQRACGVLASGYAKLRTEPRLSLGAAEEVQRLGLSTPGSLLLARAQFRLGDCQAAHAALSRLPDSVVLTSLSAEVLREFAACAQLDDAPEKALAVYRALTPRIDFLPESERASVYLEAALAMAQQGTEHWSLARSYLVRASAEDDRRGIHELASAALALLHDGSKREYIDVATVKRILAAREPRRVFLAQATELALLASAHEQEEPDEAARLWKRYAATAEHPVFSRMHALETGLR